MSSTPPSPTLRRYEPGDHDRVLALHERALRDAGVDDDETVREIVETELLPEGERLDEPLDADLHAIEETYLAAGGEFLVGLVDGEVVATGGLRPVDETTAEVARMRVDPAHQGRGYGQRVLDELEAVARERGFAELTLDVTARQAAARGLYEANGYEETRREVAGDYTFLWYRKSLAGGD